MDTSPVQSTSKCGSDFSIERILSSDSKRLSTSQSDVLQVPDWLCCTRYRPPRVPRAVNGGSGRARRSGRHARVPFTAAQAAALEAAYARAPYLAPPALRALAAALHLRDDRIKIWFQNRRARERREKSATITPPLTVTLRPTTNVHTWVSPNCTWTSTRNDVPSHSMNYNSEERTHVETQSIYTNYSERSSFSKPPDKNPTDAPLDIETIED